VLGGALCYGTSSVISRLRPASDAVSTAAAVTLLAALLTLPGGVRAGLPAASTLSLPALAAVLFLGLMSTATAMIVYFRLIQSAGPSFTSQLNFLIPLWAVGVGVLFLGEEPTVNHLYGLGLILGGILVARREPRSAVG
jgi:drug/metabolite transporter (DMT)-like permease